MVLLAIYNGHSTHTNHTEISCSCTSVFLHLVKSTFTFRTKINRPRLLATAMTRVLVRKRGRANTVQPQPYCRCGQYCGAGVNTEPILWSTNLTVSGQYSILWTRDGAGKRSAPPHPVKMRLCPAPPCGNYQNLWGAARQS